MLVYKMLILFTKDASILILVSVGEMKILFVHPSKIFL